MQTQMKVISLGSNRDSRRVYLQGKWLARAGFAAGAPIEVRAASGRVTIRLTPTGTRTVSGKRCGTVPVIDIENQDLGRALGMARKLTVEARGSAITITPAYTAMLAASRQLTATEGSLFSGGGILSEAARQAGFIPRFGIEINERYADIYAANHMGASVFNASVEEISYERLREYRPLGLLTMGMPCDPFAGIRSRDRVTGTKRDRALPPEAHELGDMVVWALRAVEAANPYTVICEQVPQFLQSGAGFILQHALRRLGYVVEARVLAPVDYGELTGRRRAVVVASMSRSIQWPEPLPMRPRRRLGEILDPPELVESLWFDRGSKPWLFDHWDRQTARGNGFASQVVRADSTSVGTIKKRYFAGQGDNPVLQHPSRPDVYRWLTLSEVRRLHGIPDDYVLGEGKTIAGEIIGQGVVVGLFRRIIESVTGGGGAVAVAATERVA